VMMTNSLKVLIQHRVVHLALIQTRIVAKVVLLTL
jgi:hypothetical protein